MIKIVFVCSGHLFNFGSGHLALGLMRDGSLITDDHKRWLKWNDADQEFQQDPAAQGVVINRKYGLAEHVMIPLRYLPH